MNFRVHGWFIGGGLTIVWTCLCTSFVGSAWAQPKAVVAPISSNDESLADRYFFEAKARAAEQNWEEAYQLLEKAWELKPSHDIAGNLGQVALKLGRYKKAATFLDRCLRLFPPTGKAEQRAQIQALFKSARRHVAAIRLHVVPQPGEMLLDRVEVLGAASEQLEPIFVDPGTHDVQIRREGQIVADKTFMAVSNAVQDVTLALGDNSNGAAKVSVRLSSLGTEVSPHEPATAPSQRSKVPVVVGATIAVGAFVSAAILIDAANKQVKTANRLSSELGNNIHECSVPAPPPQCQGLYDANVSADARYNWGHAMLGLGAAALLATGTYIFWPSQDPKESKDHSGTHGTVSLGYSAGRASIAWLGRF